MKKYKLFSLFLSFVLLVGLMPTASAGIIDEMEVNATAAILVEEATGEVLYEQNAREKRYPASITKVMTALLTIRAVEEGALSMDEIITVSESAMEGLSADGSTQNIKPGEQLSVQDLLYCTLVASANEACNILAEAVAGSVDGFVEQMNQEAARLGMTGTHFSNPHGLHRDDHYTTAYDIYLMAHEAMKYPTFREIVSSVDYYVPETNLHKQRHFYTTNALLTSWRYLGYTYREAIGIKTGSTPEAGQCLLSAAQREDRILYAVVLGCENVADESGKIVDRPSFSESKRLLEWGFDHFERMTVLETTDLQGEVKITLSKTEQVVAAPVAKIESTLPKDVKKEDLKVESVLFEDTLEAPVEKGQVLGEVTVSYGNKVCGTVDLVALNDVEQDIWMYRMHQARLFFGQFWVKAALVGLAVLIVLLIVWRLVVVHRNRRRRRYSYHYRGKRR